MSVTSEVRRTLVKSPPELWAELSDQAALARHLSDFGEIQIVAVQPEKRVEWEGPQTTGTIELASSGWGTKVTLTATQQTPEPQSEAEELLEPEPVEANAEIAEREPIEAKESPEPELVELVAVEVIPLPQPQEPEPEESPEPEPIVAEAPVEEPELEHRRGFLRRLFRRRGRPEQMTIEPDDSLALEEQPMAEQQRTIETQDDLVVELHAIEQQAVEAHEDETTIEAQPTIEEQPPAEPELQLAEELAATEATLAAHELANERAAEQATAVLTAVLDRLGAAHHRPFSRA